MFDDEQDQSAAPEPEPEPEPPLSAPLGEPTPSGRAPERPATSDQPMIGDFGPNLRGEGPSALPGERDAIPGERDAIPQPD